MRVGFLFLIPLAVRSSATSKNTLSLDPVIMIDGPGVKVILLAEVSEKRENSKRQREMRRNIRIILS